MEIYVTSYTLTFMSVSGMVADNCCPVLILTL